MTFEQAATLSVVYIAALHSLFDLGNLTVGRQVLIHSAAGGVGLAAIQLAKFVGAEVFATVGSEEKREFLKSTFDISDDRDFYSRNAALETLPNKSWPPLKVKGVDVVLNSLSGDMLNESFRILADGGVL